MEALVKFKNISKSFKDVDPPFRVLNDISFDIKPGEFFCVVGPSGCGKSTLLRMLAKLDLNFSGEIEFENSFSLDGNIGFVFQQFGLFPWLSVYENVRIPLIAKKLHYLVEKKKILAVLKDLGLDKYADTRPNQLSGGLKQRVGFARALMSEPKILLMDEPFSELDTYTAEELRKDLLSIWQKTGLTVLMVTHLVSEAIELADRIAVLTPRPAKIERIVNNHLARPRNPRSKEFFDLEDELVRLIRP